MGQKVTLSLKGSLELKMDGMPTARPLAVNIEGLDLDLDALMEQGMITLDADSSDMSVELQGVTLTFVLDADEILSRGSSAIVRGLEELVK